MKFNQNYSARSEKPVPLLVKHPNVAQINLWSVSNFMPDSSHVRGPGIKGSADDCGRREVRRPPTVPKVRPEYRPTIDN